MEEEFFKKRLEEEEKENKKLKDRLRFSTIDGGCKSILLLFIIGIPLIVLSLTMFFRFAHPFLYPDKLYVKTIDKSKLPWDDFILKLKDMGCEIDMKKLEYELNITLIKLRTEESLPKLDSYSKYQLENIEKDKKFNLDIISQIKSTLQKLLDSNKYPSTKTIKDIKSNILFVVKEVNYKLDLLELYNS